MESHRGVPTQLQACNNQVMIPGIILNLSFCWEKWGYLHKFIHLFPREGMNIKNDKTWWHDISKVSQLFQEKKLPTITRHVTPFRVPSIQKLWRCTLVHSGKIHQEILQWHRAQVVTHQNHLLRWVKGRVLRWGRQCKETTEKVTGS